MANTDIEKLIKRRMEKAKSFLGTYMNDNASLNRLIRKKELNPEQYELAVILAIEDYNLTAPVTTVNLADWPANGLKLLLQGASIQFLIMAGVLQSRNRLNYSAGGVSVAVSDKANEYQSWLQWFVNDYETKKMNYKKFMNINNALDGDGSNSEYNSLYGYYW